MPRLSPTRDVCAVAPDANHPAVALIANSLRSPATRRPARPIAALLAGTLALVGCSPTFNWRDLRPANTPLQALMPCKPDVAERNLPLAGTPTVVHMNSCDAGGLTFAVAWAEVQDPSRIPEVLSAWRAGTLANLRTGPSTQEPPAPESEVRVSGADATLAVQASGQGPGGEPVQVQALYFSKGPQVFQAAVYGKRLPSEALTTFFEGLQLP